MTKPAQFEKTFPMQACGESVFSALSEPRRLEAWFAEHARVEPRPGGAFRFWGRHTPWVFVEADADGVIEHFAPGRTLAFAFTWRGVRNEVWLQVADTPQGADLHVRHAAATDLGFGTDGSALIADFWILAIGNLRAHLAGREALLRPDYAAETDVVRESIEIEAPAEAVFRALTEPAELDQWIAKAARVELREGGAFSFGWTDGDGEPAGPRTVLEVVPRRMIVHDWHFKGEDVTRVRWDLEPIGEGLTRVTITHERFPAERIRRATIQGWSAFMLLLKDFAEGRRAGVHRLG